MDFGFIITRHVNSEKTNYYWNHCIQCIRTFYPHKKIIVIDDNSNQNFIKKDFDYKNVEYIQSEHPGRGELLPFLYFLKNRWFERAVIIHDSTFFRKRVTFERLKAPVMPLWHFDSYNDSILDPSMRTNHAKIAKNLKNYSIVKKYLLESNKLGPGNMIQPLGMKRKIWQGFFGVQCFIHYDFLKKINDTYDLTRLIPVVKCRDDRCGMERIMAVLCYIEFPNLISMPSLFGNIFTYHPQSYSYNVDQYIEDSLKKQVGPYPVIKIWSGR